MLPGGELGDWDYQQSWGAGVRQTENGWEMTYTGGAVTDGSYQAHVGYAYSNDGIHWTKYADNPIVSVDDHSTLFTSLVVHEGQYFVYYGLTPNTGTAFTEPHVAVGTIE